MDSIQQHRLKSNKWLVRGIGHDALIGLSLKHQVAVLAPRSVIQPGLSEDRAIGKDLVGSAVVQGLD